MSWPVVTLGEVAETALGKMLDKGKRKGLPVVPYLRNVNVQWGRVDTHDLLTMELADSERVRFAVEPNDLLVCEGGEIGRCAIWRGGSDYIAYQKALHRVRPGPLVDVRFLRHLLELHSKTGTLARFATGSTIAHLPQQQLRHLPVPLPSLDEQRRIVDLLEDHLSRLDAAERTLQDAARRLRSFECSALEKDFGSGPTVPLDELTADISAGKSFGAANHPAAEGEWGIVKVSAMTWGEFRAEENKAVAGDRIDPRYEIKSGDLLVSRANTADYVGASVLVRDVRSKLLLSDKSLRIMPRPGVNPEWLWRALQAPSARSQIRALATGTKDSMRNISQSALRKVALPLADQEGQARALRSFAVAANASERLRGEIERSSTRCQQLRRSLLAAAFSGCLTAKSDADDLLSP